MGLLVLLHVLVSLGDLEHPPSAATPVTPFILHRRRLHKRRWEAPLQALLEDAPTQAVHQATAASGEPARRPICRSAMDDERRG